MLQVSLAASWDQGIRVSQTGLADLAFLYYSSFKHLATIQTLLLLGTARIFEAEHQEMVC